MSLTFSIDEVKTEFARVCAIDFPCVDGIEVQYTIRREPPGIIISVITRTGDAPLPLMDVIEKNKQPYWSVKIICDPTYVSPRFTQKPLPEKNKVKTKRWRTRKNHHSMSTV
jgi:hypothetical protein